MHRDADQIPNLFGSYVFNEEAMSQYVDEAAMNAWRACLRDGRPLTLDVAGAIADGMKVWRWSTAQRTLRTGSSR